VLQDTQQNSSSHHTACKQLLLRLCCLHRQQEQQQQVASALPTANVCGMTLVALPQMQAQQQLLLSMPHTTMPIPLHSSLQGSLLALLAAQQLALEQMHKQ
jgi:hypothetical protein